LDFQAPTLVCLRVPFNPQGVFVPGHLMISTSFFPSHACLLAMVVAFLTNFLCVGDGGLGADGGSGVLADLCMLMKRSLLATDGGSFYSLKSIGCFFFTPR
jgi:hypothetical protein